MAAIGAAAPQWVAPYASECGTGRHTVAMGAIELQDVAVVHDGRTVLEGVDLRVGDGEVVALLGRSGAGKTSLLRVVAGSDRPAAGRVLIGGRDVTGLPSRDRDLGMVAQGAPLQPTRDVEGNLRLPLDLRGDDPEESRHRVLGEALRFGLRRLLGRRPRQLSMGEQHAAATARSVIRDPSALLLDEPAMHLDPTTRAAVLQQVGIVQRTRGTTMLLATNDLGIARALAHRVAVIDRRTVLQVDTLAALRAAPATLDVADLVFPTPLARLPGQVVAGDRRTRTRVRTPAGDVPTWDTRVRDHDGPVLVALAPRDLELVAPDAGQLRGQVDRIATTGARRLVTVTTAAGTVTVDTDVQDVPPDAGTDVSLAVHRALVGTTDGDVLAVLARP